MMTKKAYHIFLGELIGTFILVFFGCTVVAVAVLKLAQVELWQVAAVWGLAVTIGILISAHFSGAHLNPAITVMLFVFQRTFSLKQLFLYVSSQLIGATIAGGTVYVLFRKAIKNFELTFNIKRGSPGSELTAMIFGEYFPNPSLAGQVRKIIATTSFWEALIAEMVGTAILALVVLYLNEKRILLKLQPFIIGLTLALLINFIAPYTQAGLNPARDFGPRIISFLAGWGRMAIPGPQASFLVYLVGPILGALLGGKVAQLIAAK